MPAATIVAMSAPTPVDWHVLIPVKGGPDAKSRLRPPDGVPRSAIAEAMAQDCVAAAVAGMPPGRVRVVTPDGRVARWAAALGAEVVREPGGGLDQAARSGAEAVGGGAVAVLLGDLPCLLGEDVVAALAAASLRQRAVVPDAEGTGTVLLTALRTDDLAPSFGRGSAARHETAGHQRLDLPLPRLRTDVDDDRSLAAARELGLGPRTAQLLHHRCR